MPGAPPAVERHRPVFSPYRLQCITCSRSFCNRSGLTQHCNAIHAPRPVGDAPIPAEDEAREIRPPHDDNNVDAPILHDDELEVHEDGDGEDEFINEPEHVPNRLLHHHAERCIHPKINGTP